MGDFKHTPHTTLSSLPPAEVRDIRQLSLTHRNTQTDTTLSYGQMVTQPLHLPYHRLTRLRVPPSIDYDPNAEKMETEKEGYKE